MLDITDVPDLELLCECGHVGSDHSEGGCRGAVPAGTEDKRTIPRHRTNNCPCKGFEEKMAKK